MSVIYILLPLALIIAAFAVFAFIWATRDGQMDDLDTPSVRMLFDDDDPEPRE
jgi:cbb3-type cytochrome oxidase maturation protein